jgi:membrane-associated protein
MTEFIELAQLGILLYGAPVLGLAVLAGAFGFPIPSSLLLIAAGVFSRQGTLDWYYAAALGLLGAVLGDSLGFAFGRWGGNWITQRYGNSIVWNNAQSTFNRGSGVAVLLTRFLITTIAVPVNFMAGSSRLRFRSFLFYVILGEAMWVILYGGVGYFFGSQWELIYSVIGNIAGIVMTLFAAGILVYLWRQIRNGRWVLNFQFARIPFKRLP